MADNIRIVGQITDTGDCYTIRMKDGLIERVNNTLNTNKKINVETTQGFKQLLNG